MGTTAPGDTQCRLSYPQHPMTPCEVQLQVSQYTADTCAVIHIILTIQTGFTPVDVRQFLSSFPP